MKSPIAGRASKIDRYPAEVKVKIATWQQAGLTIDEILGHLREYGDLGPISRSALGRYLQRTREVAVGRAIIQIAEQLPALIAGIQSLVLWSRFGPK